MANVSVLGAGSWGLGLALLLNNNGHNVTVWSVLKDEVDMLQTEREHKRCLPGVKIPDSITISGDTENVINSADVLVLAVASLYPFYCKADCTFRKGRTDYCKCGKRC